MARYDGGVNEMLSGLREPVDEDAPRKGSAPPRKRRPKKDKESYGKGKSGRVSSQDSFDN